MHTEKASDFNYFCKNVTKMLEKTKSRKINYFTDSDDLEEYLYY